jgi:hypothetical protein
VNASARHRRGCRTWRSGFREIADKAIRRGSFSSVDQLIRAIEEFIKVHNDDPKPFVWTATADEIIERSSADESPCKQSSKTETHH